jgi:hypothetical protein
MRQPARLSSRRRADRREASRSRALLNGDRDSPRRAVGRLVDAGGATSVQAGAVSIVHQAALGTAAR